MTRSSSSPQYLHSNASAIEEINELQERTLEALNRAEGQLEITRVVATDTLDELRDQTETLEKIHTNHTSRLKENLDTGRKQLNRFARGAFKLGSRNRAKKERKKEEKRTQKHHKKRTRAAPKNTNGTQLLSNAAGQPRQELFENMKTKDTTKDSSASITKGEPLDDEHQRGLLDIENADARIDARIDALGDGVTNLLAMASALEDEVDHQNHFMFEPIQTNLEKCETKLNLNNRQLKRLNKR